MGIIKIFLWFLLINIILVPAVLVPILVVTNKKRAEHVVKKSVILPKACKNCGHPVPPGSPFCVICGSKAE